MKIPQRGEIWKSNDLDFYTHIVWLDKFSVNCVSFYKGKYGVLRTGTLNFLRHHHFVTENWSCDVERLFEDLKHTCLEDELEDDNLKDKPLDDRGDYND